jgi:hypothetical protein
MIDSRCIKFLFLRLVRVFFVGLQFELRASHVQSRLSTAQATPAVHFALVILEIGSLKLFAQTGIKLQSSQSQAFK